MINQFTQLYLRIMIKGENWKEFIFDYRIALDYLSGPNTDQYRYHSIDSID